MKQSKNKLKIMIGNDWDQVLKKEFESDYFKKIEEFTNEEYATRTVYPPKDEIFNAFKFTPLKNVKVVILGQDPYHEEGQAHGLAFSTPEGRPIPRSLKNIFKEIENEYSYPIPESGCLESWAKQGVFLLNTVLTVREGDANSHSDCGWQIFTDNVIKILNSQPQPIVFLLWGKQAEKKKEFLDNPDHLVLVTSHPSPFSARRGFFGSNHFKLANEFLSKNNIKEICWKL
nr:uracil-DNA glycosylase [Methanobrevibacter millerae]